MNKRIAYFNKLFLTTIISTLLFSCSNKNVEVVSIPDENFEKALIKIGLDKVQDGKLKVTDEVKNCKSLDLRSSNISNLAGIEVFSNLENLYCELNKLKNLNLSNNIHLEKLWCSGNDLTTINLNGNRLLKELDCSFNELNSINLSNDTSLKFLDCNFNHLTELNLDSNKNLEILEVALNKLSKLNLKINNRLKSVSCFNNELTNLEFGTADNLQKIKCQNNLQLTNLDVSNLKSLKELDISSTQIKELNIYQNHSLVKLQADSNFKDLYQTQNLVALNRIANVQKDNYGEYNGFYWAIVILLLILIFILIRLISKIK
jgi:Leucine-rich repeat (LRR) protein